MKRATLLVAAGLLLAGCGSVHPGDAAVVDGIGISMSTLDDTAAVYCEITARSAQQQGVQSIDNAEIRRQAVSDLVLTRVAEDLVAERDLTVDQSLVDLSPEEQDQIGTEFGDDAAEVARVIEDSRHLFAMYATIGAAAQSVILDDTNTEALTQAGQQIVAEAVADGDVTFAPRFGIDDSGAPNGSIGSLSVATTGADAELLPSSACSA